MYWENKAEVEEKLKSAASVSKDLSSNIVVNTEVSEVHSHQPEASLASSSTVNDPLEEFKGEVRVHNKLSSNEGL